MVFTLTAAMLVGTPLTASAAGLVDLYKTEDGWGNTVGSNGDDDTRTGTVTATQTNTTVLDEAGDSLLGISLDEVDLEVKSLNETPTLTATLDWKEGKKDTEKEAIYLKQLKWSSSDRNIVALRAGEEFKGGPRNKITLVPKAAGVATITVSLNKDGKTICSAEATVTVENYAGGLAFDKDKIKDDAYKGNILILDEYVIRNGNKGETTSDVLTYAIKDPKKATTFKNGVLTLKKAESIEVKAIGKYVASEWETISIATGSNVKKLVVVGDQTQKWSINEKGRSGYEVRVKAEQKDGTDPCTNQVTWTSKQPSIVDIEESESRFNNEDICAATLVAKSAGKAQIVAKASNGKSATIKVIVSADLTKIDIQDVPDTLYSGQSIDLYAMANQYFGKDADDEANINFTDAGLKWSLASGDKNVAKINPKGVLTISADLSKATSEKITVKAENAKKTSKAAKGSITDTTDEITLIQIDVTGIVVRDDKGNKILTAPVADGKVGQYEKVTETIVIDQERTYTITATAKDGSGANITDETILKSVLGWSASGNGKIVKTRRTIDAGTIKGIKKGTATVSVTGASRKGNAYKAVKVTFKEQVTVPTKSLTLSVKNKGIAATGKTQKIQVTPKFDKGSTTKNDGKGSITWLAWKNNERNDSIIDKKGKLTLTAGSYSAGDTIKVRAIVKDGPIKTITLTVFDASNKVEFRESAEATQKLKPLKMKVGDPEKNVVTRVIFNDKSIHVPGNVDDKEHIAPVTYTMNKAGIVRVVDKENGNVMIEPLTKGVVTITATTADGKKGTMKVTVTE